MKTLKESVNSCVDNTVMSFVWHSMENYKNDYVENYVWEFARKTVDFSVQDCVWKSVKKTMWGYVSKNIAERK